MSESIYREAFLKGFFDTLRLAYDLLRAPFVVAAAYINDEPSPLVRQRKQS